MSEEAPARFSSVLPVVILTRPAGQTVIDWQVADQGPGYFDIPPGNEIRVKIKSINDDDLAVLVNELKAVEPLRFLDLSENRNVTNQGLQSLKELRQLTGLNLSSCSITSTGMENSTQSQPPILFEPQFLQPADRSVAKNAGGDEKSNLCGFAGLPGADQRRVGSYPPEDPDDLPLKQTAWRVKRRNPEGYMTSGFL